MESWTVLFTSPRGRLGEVNIFVTSAATMEEAEDVFFRFYPDSEIMWVNQGVDFSLMVDEYDDSMDGDHESALASAGLGTDEDYGLYGDQEC